MPPSFFSKPLLPVFLEPFPGEHIRGFIRRLGRANGFTHLSSVNAALNVSNSFGPEGSDHTWRNLSLTTGLPLSVLETMRWKSVPTEAGPQLKSFLGTRIGSAFLMPRSLRICPSCLAENDTIWSFWNIAYATACPRHHTALIDTCSCGKRLSDSYSLLHLGCECGQRFAELPAMPASASAVRVASNLNFIIDRNEAGDNGSAPIELPSALQSLRAQDYLVLIHSLGLAATTTPEADIPVTRNIPMYRNGNREEPLPISVLNQRIESASSIIDGWPNALFELLDGLVYRNGASTEVRLERRAFATKIGRMFLNPLRGSTGLPLPVLHEAMTSYCAIRLGVRRRVRNPTVREPVARRIQRYVSLSNIADRVNSPSQKGPFRRTYARIISSLSDADINLSNESLARLVADRTVALYTRAQEAVSLYKARELLEGVNNGANSPTSWHHPQLLMPDPKLYGLQRPSLDFYRRESLDQILDRIEGVATRVANTSGLQQICDAIRAGGLHTGYSRTQFLIDVLDGLLPVYTVVDRPNFSALFADPGDIRRLAADRRGFPLDGSETYLRPSAINDIIERRLGKPSRLPTSELVGLAEDNVIRFELDLRSRPGRPGPRKIYRFCTQDVIAHVMDICAQRK
ncbi:MAG: TniQ family protein [Rhodoblastus sp.]|uniref:TniQ family protein n=1 Tax=Rhodoblastus sp. TaxID=1962975 RepID=UPI003F9632B0